MPKKKHIRQLGSFGKLAFIAVPLTLLAIYMVADQNGLIPSQKSSDASSSLGITAWASRVEPGTKVGTNPYGQAYQPTANRANPAFGIGPANFEPSESTNNTFYSLGYGGEVVYSFSKRVKNADGFDITIHEATIGDRKALSEDRAEIEVSQNGSTWKKIGNASSRSNDGGEGISKLNISSTGWSWIKYVKIRDTSNRSLGKSYDDGFDIDAIGAVKTESGGGGNDNNNPVATNTPKPIATNTPRPVATNTPRPVAINTPRPTVCDSFNWWCGRGPSPTPKPKPTVCDSFNYWCGRGPSPTPRPTAIPTRPNIW